ncbi:ABC transporter permease subunit [Leptotrichia sp. OH3620_COT-345]|uniref:PhnE/PtxC family ABC transporter permease n=1 Tax=Leptotrichia sp. OH3620_COT-345 TaxID=2491048 RepID=UPI000F6462B5|nr:ABC transporter permease subunit [Leptotrichia sp. OH3620_COT-345]RRD39927.1 ABC transporter permease subunit [Leptotrichia sp. OH3620_COT-345]
MTDFKYAERTRKNKIKIRKITKSGIYLWGTLGTCVLLGFYKLVTINTGKIYIFTAIEDFFKNVGLMFFQPRLSERYTFAEILQSLGVTLSLGLLTTLISAFFALFFSFFAAKNLSGEKLSKVIKVLISFVRSVPTILWVTVFSAVIGVGAEAAVIGICFHSTAYLIKAYSESTEEINAGIVEAMKSTGASRWKIIFQGILPSTAPSILSWTFVRFEMNFTNAVVVGAAAGAGGIGYEMFMAGSMYFDSREIGFFVYLVLGIALLLESISVYLKKKYIKGSTR